VKNKTTTPSLFDAPQVAVMVPCGISVEAAPVRRIETPKPTDPQKAFDDAVEAALLVYDGSTGPRPASKGWLVASGKALALGRKLPWAPTGWLFGG
jgi:hypothetical protein